MDRQKLKDWLTIVILILYLSSSVIETFNPGTTRRIILELDEIEQIIEFGE